MPPRGQAPPTGIAWCISCWRDGPLERTGKEEGLGRTWREGGNGRARGTRNPELGSRELKGQAEVEEEESFLGSTFCWMVDQFFYDSSWHALGL